ncbi:hypothetical protein DPX39_050032500 [Trypanosoma brucei equiperdum]|uniref:Uncharacterized protein n=1 Tax=Trypanosoma brucei equiperdum TaxID=630700 RepID=A0A3L6L6K6_9TRYP|nr:hypothetical protein DPX39_050032500 [Trypanosoma brucei equiperdum]
MNSDPNASVTRLNLSESAAALPTSGGSSMPSWADTSLLVNAYSTQTGMGNDGKPPVVHSLKTDIAPHYSGRLHCVQREPVAGASNASNLTRTERNYHAEISVLWRLLHSERAALQATERRVFEEQERGMRGIISTEANYGAKLLHAFLLESLDLQTTTDDWTPPVREKRDRCPRVHMERAKARSAGKKTPLDSNQSAPPDSSSPSAPSYEQLREENRLLRAEVERYKAIDTEDRLELNKMHRSMRATITQLVHECSKLHAELSRHEKTPGAAPVAVVQSPCLGESDSAFAEVSYSWANHASHHTK